MYSTPDITIPEKITKRFLLSFIASLFDPLGLIGPINVIGKILMQQLWQAKITWDESLPMDLHSEALTYISEIHAVSNLNIQRNVVISNRDHIEIHGFCDASETAYGACIYIKGTDSQGIISCNLLCAKSRVAPIKTISLPRLELCGALLLAELTRKVLDSIHIIFSSLRYFTGQTLPSY